MEAELSKLLSEQSTADQESDPDVLAMQAKAARCKCRSAEDYIVYQGLLANESIYDIR